MSIKYELTASEPIEIGSQIVTSLHVREPTIFDLRDLRLTDVLQMEMNAMCTLLPRVTKPEISSAQLSQLAPYDFVSLCARVVLFFASETPDKTNEAEQ